MVRPRVARRRVGRERSCKCRRNVHCRRQRLAKRQLHCSDQRRSNLMAQRYQRPTPCVQQIGIISADHSNGRKIVVSKPRIALIAVIAAFSCTLPAFAQSFDRTWGTGNVLPSYFDQSGALHMGIAPQRNGGGALPCSLFALCALPAAARRAQCASNLPGLSPKRQSNAQLRAEIQSPTK